MAKLIRKGVTPVFGVENEVGLLINSFNLDSSITEYEQLNSSGAKCGLSLYDQVITFKLDANIIYNGTSDDSSLDATVSKYAIGTEVALANEYQVLNMINSDMTPDVPAMFSIVKGCNLTLNAGQPASLSANGNIYLFAADKVVITE